MQQTDQSSFVKLRSCFMCQVSITLLVRSFHVGPTVSLLTFLETTLLLLPSTNLFFCCHLETHQKAIPNLKSSYKHTHTFSLCEEGYLQFFRSSDFCELGEIHVQTDVQSVFLLPPAVQAGRIGSAGGDQEPF